MLCKKGICLLLFVAAVLLLATAPARCQRENLDMIRADGGAPPAPPIPWLTGGGVIVSPYLNADGGAPPAPHLSSDNDPCRIMLLSPQGALEI